MMMADSQPARFSIEDLLRSRHDILASVLPPPSVQKDDVKKSVEQHVTMPSAALNAMAGTDQLPFWLSCAAASFPLEQSLLMAQRTG
ncbi:unnamed protein product [Strongylus vulgaris]|uniref:Uncharacterized protein n=1 Tax=Strongylus vulgaris TaxID=40348 RepID=A0A3P7KKR6_STRVU|nr:unnamed protein product [Strongylus vulgaris]